jgi:hypothetical protein
MNPRDFVEIKYGQWWEQVSQKPQRQNMPGILELV